MANPPTPTTRRKATRRALSLAAPAAVFVALCFGPYAGRLAHPSLYADDVVRVEQLQTETLGAMLFRPFNEHMAPLFQLESWLTWRLAGRSLATAPVAFTLASYAPFLVVLWLLARVIQRETGSRTTALAGVAVFSLSWLSIETVYWYSASSFMGALLGALVAWLGVSGGPSRRGSVLAAIGAALAPAFSAVGLIAGPFAAIRAVSASRPDRRNLGAAAAPIAGTLLYLTVCAAFRYQDVLADNLGNKASFGPGLFAAARAPFEALLPALIGLRPHPARGGTAVLLASLGVLGSVALILHARRRDDERRLTAGGLFLIFGGYALAFCARPDATGVVALNTQRYHLFPMLGLVLLLAPWFRRAFSRWDDRPTTGLWAVSALAAVLLVSHASEMRGRGRFLAYPDQTRTLAALDRLGAACARLGVTRDQALAALDPIETEWTPRGHSALIMLPHVSPTSRLRDDQVKAALLAALSSDDRQSVCGGMDATPYLTSATEPTGDVSVGRAVRFFRVRAGASGCTSEGWPSFVEYAMTDAAAAGARALVLDGEVPGGVTEVWWRGDSQRWSETRSVRLSRDRSRVGRPWVLPLDRLPHWHASDTDRLRLLYHDPGPVAAAPRLVR